MKYAVITLHQPWASWVIDGYKKIETRTHDRFRSLNGKLILIHSSQKYNDDGALQLYNGIFHKGKILGCVKVYHFNRCCYHDSENANIECESGNRFGLFLKNPVKFEIPVTAKGKQGIWYHDLELGEVIT